MTHKGEIIENAIRQSGYPITEVAKKLGISRRHLYNLFQKYTISQEVIVRIGKIINHDFSIEIKNLTPLMTAEEPEVKYGKFDSQKAIEEIEYWKNKYIALLEEHKSLLERSKK